MMGIVGNDELNVQVSELAWLWLCRLCKMRWGVVRFPT
jgi:hypothetical protein